MGIIALFLRNLSINSSNGDILVFSRSSKGILFLNRIVDPSTGDILYFFLLAPRLHFFLIISRTSSCSLSFILTYKEWISSRLEKTFNLNVKLNIDMILLTLIFLYLNLPIVGIINNSSI